MKIKKKDTIRLLNSLIEKVLTYKLIDFTYNIATPVREKPSENGTFTDLEHTNDYIIDLHIHLFRKSNNLIAKSENIQKRGSKSECMHNTVYYTLFNHDGFAEQTMRFECADCGYILPITKLIKKDKDE